MKASQLIILVFSIFVFTLNCSDTNSANNGDPAEDLLKIGDTTTANTIVEVYLNETPLIGYNKIYFKVTDRTTDKISETAQITLSTLMDMGMHQHASPYESPAGNDAEDGLFVGAANFIMAGMWQLHFHIHNMSNDDHIPFQLVLDVGASNRVKNIVGADSSTYFVTLVKPVDPVVGINELEITVHQRQSMMSFLAVEGLSISMEPTMPSMGHGSPNNVDPLHDNIGHYKGQVNFTMTGDWLIDFEFSDGDSLMSAGFEITVP